MEVGTVYGGYYGAKGYERVRKEEKRADAGREKKARQQAVIRCLVNEEHHARTYHRGHGGSE